MRTGWRHPRYHWDHKRCDLKCCDRKRFGNTCARKSGCTSTTAPHPLRRSPPWHRSHDLTPGTWTIDASHSTVGFTARHLMITKVRGRFGSVSGAVTVAEDPLPSSVEATVDLASVDTGDAGRDEHLRSADFFDVENHPDHDLPQHRREGRRRRLRPRRRPHHQGRHPPGRVRPRVRRRQRRPVGRHPGRLHRRGRDQPQGLRASSGTSPSRPVACSSATRSRCSSTSSWSRPRSADSVRPLAGRGGPDHRPGRAVPEEETHEGPRARTRGAVRPRPRAVAPLLPRRPRASRELPDATARLPRPRPSARAAPTTSCC